MPNPYLTYLVPKTNLAFWYPLDNATDSGGVVNDESGNGRHLNAVLPGINTPALTENVLNGRRGIVHTNNTDFLQHTGAITVRELWTIAKMDYATTFPATYGGFISGLGLSLALYIGAASTNRFLSVAEGNQFSNYWKSGIELTDGARTAPFAYFEQMRQNKNSDIGLDGLQVGQDRTFTARLFQGRWVDIMGYSAQLSLNQVYRLKLYGDLKFELWRLNGTTLSFPDPTLTDIPYRRFNEVPRDWPEATISHEYEDGGRSFNEITDTPPREWELEMDCYGASHTVAKEQFDIFDAFWNAARTTRTFSFLDKYGVTHTSVRIKEYSRSHDANKSWQNSVTFRLIKYP